MRNRILEGLRRIVSTGPQRPTGDYQATVIAVATRKGGVGKTTTAVHLATALVRDHQRRVLLLDLDPQGHVHRALHTLARPGGLPLSTILDRETDADVLDAVVPSGLPGLDLTATDGGLVETENRLTGRIGKETVLRDALKICRTHYDVIVLDCPPNLGNLSLNALVAADRILVPTDLSPLAIQGVESLLQNLGTIVTRLHPTLDLLGVLVTRRDARNGTINDTITAELEARLGDLVLPISIPAATAITKAQQAGMDVFAFDPKSKVAAAYRALGDLVAARLPTRSSNA